MTNPQVALKALMDQFTDMLTFAKKRAPIVGVIAIHDTIDKAITKDVGQVTCARGCNFCCYIEVTTATEEGKMLARHVKREMLPALAKQAAANKWNDLPYQDRKCVFLKNGECSVYDIRPAVCRKYAVASPAKDCNTEHQINQVSVAVVFAAEAATFSLHEVYGSDRMARTIMRNL